MGTNRPPSVSGKAQARAVKRVTVMLDPKQETGQAVKRKVLLTTGRSAAVASGICMTAGVPE